MRSRMPVRRLIGKAWLRAFGWTVDDRVPNVDKAVVVAAPHTSNWDLPFSLAVAWTLGIQMQWVGKHTLFRAPFGAFMRALGGVAVNRTAPGGAVDALVDVIKGHEQLMLVIAPQGTRRGAARWKTGFYWAAVGAKVPIVLGFLDYTNKRGGLGEVFVPTGDVRRDFESIRAFYSPIRGKYPEHQGEITLGPEDTEPRS